MARQQHSFEFAAHTIADAAGAEAKYHEERAQYWQAEMDDAYAKVEATLSVKIEKQQHTDGYTPVVTADYGDKAAYFRMQEAAAKIQHHQKAAKQYRSDEQLYRTQLSRHYDLDINDVHHYHLSGGTRNE